MSGSGRGSHPGTHLCHVDWSEALSFDQAVLVPGVAAQCPVMLFLGLHSVKLDCLKRLPPSRWSLSLPWKERELHNLTVLSFRMQKMIITFFDFCYPLVSQKGFDLLLIVVIAVALLTFLLLISVLCDDYQSSFCQVASIESNLCLLFIPQCIRLNHMKLQFLQSPDIKGICLSVTPITIDLTCKSAVGLHFNFFFTSA